MSDELAEALRRLSAALEPYARRNPEALAVVAAAGRLVTAWADAIAKPEAAEPPPPIPVPVVVAPEPVAPTATPREPVDLTRLRVPLLPWQQSGGPQPVPVVRGPGDITPPPLPLIARRARIKEAAARVAAAAPAAFDRAAGADLIRQASELPDCYLWMLDPAGYSDRPAVWLDVAEGFRAAAAAAELLELWRNLPEPFAARYASPVLHLTAEAQAVLFAAVADVGKPKPDIDQINLFVTVREEAAARQEFVRRYLKRDDRADPGSGPDVLRRVADLREELGGLAGKAKSREKTAKSLRFKLKRMAEEPAAAAGEWPRVLELLEELVAAGLPPSDREVRDLLLPVWRTYPEELPRGPGADRVFRAVDEHLAARPEPPAPETPEEPSAEVRAVAELLRGREVVFIGGLERPAARRALEGAFGLSALNWISTRPHESVTVFEAPIARPEVAVVLLAIKWASHSYGDVVDYCTKYGKPLVRLKSGYNPNQVAYQILNQVGDRLRVLSRTG